MREAQIRRTGSSRTRIASFRPLGRGLRCRTHIRHGSKKPGSFLSYFSGSREAKEAPLKSTVAPPGSHEVSHRLWHYKHELERVLLRPPHTRWPPEARGFLGPPVLRADR